MYVCIIVFIPGFLIFARPYIKYRFELTGNPAARVFMGPGLKSNIKTLPRQLKGIRFIRRFCCRALQFVRKPGFMPSLLVDILHTPLGREAA